MVTSNNTASYTILETLHEGSGSTLLRAVRTADGRPALLKVLDPGRGRPGDVDRLKQAYAIGKALDVSSVVRPLALDTYQGLPALVMEDPGGASLDRLLGAPMEIARFLELAIGIATAVAEVHRRGVIHKDIKPQNIVVDGAGEVKLTDFGIASRLPREHAPPLSPGQIAGSLPYMSPEQTGWMNRAVDDRTDLYSLGITLHEMLTGKLPFDARDPLEWIHAHVARAPTSPSEIVPEVPEVIAGIVMRLLIKMPEDRYQSARGLVHDLTRCAESWSARGRVEPFPLGERDVSERLCIPQRLYGREEEVSLLLRAFDRVVATGTPELLLVSGYSGIGKSSLVHELRRPVVAERGIFLSGKFDQHERDIPYATLVKSFPALVRDLLTEPEERLEVTRRALREALGVNGKLIADVIPQLHLLVGEQPPVPDLPRAEAESRFRSAFLRFLRVFMRPEQPLVLFLDDLQWADPGSLRLLEDVITDADTRHLLLVGAYRDNEVTPSHPLMAALARIRATPAVVQSLVLRPLALEHVVRLVADTVRADPERALPLAELVHDKTGGNPFFVIQFLRTLERERLLTLDEASLTWRWDIARIQEKGYTDNVIDFMVRRIGCLPARTQDVLMTAACVGSEVPAALLALAREEPEGEIFGALWPPIQEGLIELTRDAYVFAHDRVRQAVYVLLPEARRAELHLAIGRLLLSHTPTERLEERIFDIVKQLDAGAALITERPERTRVAELNLRAARKARASIAYAPAAGYLAAGASLLGDAWDDQYDLAFALSLERAECELLSGDVDEARRHVPVLLRRARRRLDAAAAYRVKMDVHTVEGNDGEAIGCALECLRMFGVDMSPHPSAADVEDAYQEVWRAIGDRRIEELIELPLMTDPEMQAAMEVLARLYVPAYHWDNNLLYLHLCRAVSLSLRHGNAPASTQAYGWFGLIMAGVYHRYHEGYRFARLAYDLMERHHFLAYKAKASFQMRIISYWTQPLDTMLAYSRAAFEAAVETGDVPVACFSCHHTVMGMVILGHHLSDVHSEAERGLDYVRKAGFRDVEDMIIGVDRFVQAMRGRTHHLSTYDDDRFSEAELEAELARDRMPTLVFYYYAVKLMARFLSGDYDAALAAGEKTRALLWAGFLSAHGQYYHLYHALTLAAVFDRLSPEEQREALDALTDHEEQLRRPAEIYSPTFHCPYALASAEIARVRGQSDAAMRLYDEAIRSARENGFAQHEALAYEIASRFYRRRGFGLIADTYLREARACFARWGADGKVRQIDRQSPHIIERPPLAPGATVLMHAEQIDLLSVVKASQTISGEVVLEELVRTLLEVVLEQGGARRGCLVLCRDAELFIEAEAALGEHGVSTKILQSTPLSSSPLVPVSVVNYVVRTKERVMLDDAAQEPSYASDPYIARARPRSLLCLPILRQGAVVGLLYLENDLVTGAFTPERLVTLSLLASQAAISLQSALLLSKEQAARAAAEEAERRSAILAEVGELLSRSLNYEETLTHLVRLCVRSLADWCVVDVIEGQGLRRMAGAHSDPAKEPLLTELGRRYPPRTDSAHPGARVVRTRRPLLLPELSDHDTRALCEDEDHAALLRELGTRTVLAVPLIAREQMLGVLTLATSAPGRRYGDADLELAQDVARRAAIALENARLYRQVHAAIAVRDEFLSVASHELYTPLTSLMLTLHSMDRSIRSQGSCDPQTMSVLVDRAMRQGTRLTRLSNDLLDVSRIHTDRLPLMLEDVDLGALVRGVVDQLAPALSQAGCSVSIRGEGRVIGHWDRFRIEQVLSNLLSNAIKFGAGKSIDVRFSEEGGIARLDVRDHGIGIDPARQGRIFGRFERAVSEKHYGGMGLGLYIARRIVEAHCGTIRFESQPGEGSTFMVELPSVGPLRYHADDRQRR